MSIETILRSVGTVTCIYTIGLFVTIMTDATLTAASRIAAPSCSSARCAELAYDTQAPATANSSGTMRAALFLATNF